MCQATLFLLATAHHEYRLAGQVQEIAHAFGASGVFQATEKIDVQDAACRRS